MSNSALARGWHVTIWNKGRRAFASHYAFTEEDGVYSAREAVRATLTAGRAGDLVGVGPLRIRATEERVERWEAM